MKALVITPTTGALELEDAVRSVINQSYKDVEHLVIIDGEKFDSRARDVLSKVPSSINTVTPVTLPFNTGGNGFYGHRIMAAFSHLVNHDVVLFLDQDNWFEPDHVKIMVDEIERFNLDWTYSLRKVYSKDKVYICDDNCESLGRWPVWVNEQAFLIDSSSYCFKTDFIRKVGHLWDYGWGADRRFYTILKEELKHQNYTCTGKHTLCYRVGGNEGSVTGEFFLEGNNKAQEKYNGKLPWLGKL